MIVSTIIHHLSIAVLGVIPTWIVLPWNGKRLPLYISIILSCLIMYGIKHL